jgi:hypothetical protein
LITCSLPVSNANQYYYVKGQHTGTRPAIHWKEVLDRFELTDSLLLRITTGNVSSNYLMTQELPSTLDASGIMWPAMGNHIPCMAHVIQVALGAFISSLGLKGRTKSWVAHEQVQQFGENETTDIGKSQRLQKEVNARFNKVSTMRPGVAKIIGKVPISRHCE